MVNRARDAALANERKRERGNSSALPSTFISPFVIRASSFSSLGLDNPGEERVVFLLFADRGHGTVTRTDNGVVGK
jgi:hypothetical protein